MIMILSEMCLCVGGGSVIHALNYIGLNSFNCYKLPLSLRVKFKKF